MQVKGTKTERQQLADALGRARRDQPEGVQATKIDRQEIWMWLQRLWAVQTYAQTGKARLIEAEAKALKITPEALISLYFERMAEAENPFEHVFTSCLRPAARALQPGKKPTQ